MIRKAGSDDGDEENGEAGRAHHAEAGDPAAAVTEQNEAAHRKGTLEA